MHVPQLVAKMRFKQKNNLDFRVLKKKLRGGRFVWTRDAEPVKLTYLPTG